MPFNDPIALRLADFSRFGDGPGEAGIESYLVSGVAIDDVLGPSGTSVGLPAEGQPHTGNSNLIVRDRFVAEVFNDSECRVDVYYRAVNWDIGRLYGTRISTRGRENLTLPVIVLSNSSLYSLKTPPIIHERMIVERITTVRTTESLDDIANFMGLHAGKRYMFGGEAYVLQETEAFTNRGNITIANTVFYRSVAVPAFPANSIDNHFAIPALPPLAKYVVQQDANGIPTGITATDPLIEFPLGPVIPWI